VFSRTLVAFTADANAEAGYLERALTLVRGQLLDGRDPARYAWLATDEIEYEVTAAVADAAHPLSGLRLAVGDADGAMEAARTGLRLARGPLFDGQHAFQEAQQLVNTKPMPAGTWYYLPVNPNDTDADVAEPAHREQLLQPADLRPGRAAGPVRDRPRRPALPDGHRPAGR
jgi:hypothetical protein